MRKKESYSINHAPGVNGVTLPIDAARRSNWIFHAWWMKWTIVWITNMPGGRSECSSLARMVESPMRASKDLGDSNPRKSSDGYAAIDRPIAKHHSRIAWLGEAERYLVRSGGVQYI